MAIKAGQIIHAANGMVIDRIQSAGAGNINIPEEKIYELGNYETVATVRDIPDLSFDMESFDVSTEIEALLTGNDPTATVDGDEFDLNNSVPLDVISPFKAGNGSFAVVKGIALPYLTLENATYRFGVGQNATQSFTLRGDSVYYVPGSPRSQTFTLVNNTLTYTLNGTALPYMESGDTIYVLGACVKNPTTGAYRRLFFESDYTNTATTITLTNDWFDDGYTQLHVTFGVAASDTYLQSVHPDTSVKPAAVRAKDIDVYVYNDALATPALARWTGVQSVEVTRRITLENDQEFGNSKYVSSDYDVADVTGSITIRPVDADDLWDKIAQIADVPTNEIIGPFSAAPLEVEIRISDPDTGDVLKTLYIDDARFTIPSVSSRVQSKLETTFNFSSDSGQFLVYAGERP